MRKSLVLAALLYSVSSGAVGAHEGAARSAPAVHSAEEFAVLPSIESPEISPDGHHVAGEIAVDGKQYFAIMSLDGEKPVVRLLNDELNWWRWVNDRWLVIGIGGRTEVDGEEWYLRRAIGFGTNGEIVPLLKNRAAQNGDDVIWVAHDGTPRVLLAAQQSIYSADIEFWTSVFEVDVSTGKAKRTVAPREGVMRWVADSQGVVRMGIGHSLDGRSTRVLYRSDGESNFREVVRPGKYDDLVLPALFPVDGGKPLAWAKDEDGFDAIYDYDVDAMKPGKLLYASKGFDLDRMILNREGTALAGIGFLENRARVEWLDPDLIRLQAEVAAKIKGGQAFVTSYSADHQRAIVLVSSADSPGAYFVYQRATEEMTELGFVNPALGLRRFSPVRTIHYKARDGVDIAAVLTLPRGDGKNLPLIVLPHGGPFARDDESWDWWTQFLADRGYAVVQPNYRGSSGYGEEFAEKGEGQWGLAMQDDLLDAIGALASQGIADPKRVCIAGASYGGYAALRAAERDGTHYRCAISYAGVSDLRAMKRYDVKFLSSGARADWLRKQAPDFDTVSPLRAPEAFSIPVLIMHGAKDDVVPAKQSRQMADKLKDAGKSYIYIEQPEGDHHFTRQADRLQFLKEMEAFLTKYNPS